MREHKFTLGQSVRSLGVSLPSLYGPPAVLMPAGSYHIVRQLPPLQGRPQYRIRSAGDGHERVVVEDDLCL
jgi:hypothetical protein